MKKQLFSFLGMLGLLMVAGSAFAQNIHVRANIPFSFNVDKDTLPAGQYEVREISWAGGSALAITNWQAKAGKMFLTHPVSPSTAYADKTKLVFKRYGDQYFLSQIWIANSDTGRELPRNARERELALGNVPAKVVVMAELH